MGSAPLQLIALDSDYLKSTNRFVRYTESHWRTLHSKRERALEVMETFAKYGFEPVLYGSVARGDVTERSDVDVFLQAINNPSVAETIVERELGGFVARSVVQPTPLHTLKGYIYIDELTSVSFTFSEMRRSEIEFYDVAGRVSLSDLRRGVRVAGMNKDLKVILPVEDGHVEFPADQDHDVAASLIGVDPSVIRERVTVIRRRRELGRTGLFREIYIDVSEDFGTALMQLMSGGPRRRRLV
ncbi:MAG: nucleotidyltransferase domain-containing protein [Aigarchaeota archaeon]|nr:nucleotidyltransferase domain-containing protein [Aigarchaeota archaeon]MDW8092685.1 nucleotidyltransferase domain-containing protein [Nitrososphaerota archaeon]